MVKFAFHKGSLFVGTHFLGGAWVAYLANMALTIVASNYSGDYVAVVLTQIALAFTIIGAVLLIFGILLILINTRKKADTQVSTRGNKLVIMLVLLTFILTVITSIVANVMFM